MPMAERGGTLYTVSVKELLSSTDRGKTWNALGNRPKGRAIGLIITDQAFYLSIAKKGVFRSTDAGKQWVIFNDGFNFDEASTEKKIAVVTSIENILFATTNRGVYRLNSDRWEKLSIEPRSALYTFDSLVASGNDLYVATTLDTTQLKSDEARQKEAKSFLTGKIKWGIFHSTDLGNSWIDITPTKVPISMHIATGIKLIVAGETLLALSNMYGIRSRDRGQTWTGLGEIPYTPGYTPAVAINENTFYAGKYRLRRTTDGGESWHPFMRGMVGTKMRNLVAFKNGLYVFNDGKIVKSTDGGESWAPLNFGKGVGTPHDPDFPDQRLVVADGVLYGVFRERESHIFGSPITRKSKIRIFRLSADGNSLNPVRGVPSLEFDDKLYGEALTAGEVTLGRLAVSDKTFYIEYRRELFKCKSGTWKWSNTGLIDSGKQPRNSRKGIRLAVSGETVYVGMRDGKLLQSLDGGNNWKDITPNLPFSFSRFRDILFADSAIYVSTDKGVLTSQTGEHWRVLTDSEDERLIVSSLAVDDTTVYGVCNAGAYRLNSRGKWKKISPEVPNGIRELVFANDKLYIITNRRGMFHISLKNEG